MAYDKVFTNLIFEDSWGRRKRKRVEMVTTDAATAETDGLALKVVYDGVSDGVIRYADIVGHFEFADVVPAGVNVDTGCTAQVQLDGRPERATLKWPTPSASLFLAGGVLNTADAAVVTLADTYGTGLGGIARLSDGEAISSILSGKLDK